MDIGSRNGVHCLLTLAQVQRITELSKSAVYPPQRLLIALGSLVGLIHVELALTDNLGNIMMVGKRIVAYGPQLSVGLVGLTERSVVASHVAEHSHIVVVGINIRFEVGLSSERLHIQRVQLIV